MATGEKGLEEILEFQRLWKAEQPLLIYRSCTPPNAGILNDKSFGSAANAENVSLGRSSAVFRESFSNIKEREGAASVGVKNLADAKPKEGSQSG